jgi:hypothetical protein
MSLEEIINKIYSKKMKKLLIFLGKLNHLDYLDSGFFVFVFVEFSGK